MEAEPHRLWTSSELAGLLGSSLDCVIDRAGLCRSDVHLWVKRALPVEVWQLLWNTTALEAPAAVGSHLERTGGLKAEEGSSAVELPGHESEDKVLARSSLATLAATRSLVGASAAERSSAGSHARSKPRKSNGTAIESGPLASTHATSREGAGLRCSTHATSREGASTHATSRESGPLASTHAGGEQPVRKGTLAEFFQARRNSGHSDASAVVVGEGRPGSPRHRSNQMAMQDSDTWQAGTWASAATLLPATARGYGADTQPLADCLNDGLDVLEGSKLSFRDEAPMTPKGKADVESNMRNTMSAWLDTPTKFPPILSPLQVADWLRTLPPSKVAKETKKALARRVLQYNIDGDDFQAMLNDGRWAELDLQDERESVTLLGLFKQGQHEVAMAEAARQAAKSNSSWKNLKGEMLVA